MVSLPGPSRTRSPEQPPHLGTFGCQQGGRTSLTMSNAGSGTVPRTRLRGAGTMGSEVVIGVDHVVIEDIAASLASFGRRYERRVFTDAERSIAADRTPAAYLGFLAGRFAGKEAIVKALRYPRGEPLPWTDIEILSESGWPSVTLHGPARQHAQDLGVSDVAVSISHEGAVAIAVAVAYQGHGGSRPGSPAGAPADSPAGRPTESSTDSPHETHSGPVTQLGTNEGTPQ